MSPAVGAFTYRPLKRDIDAVDGHHNGLDEKPGQGYSRAQAPRNESARDHAHAGPSKHRPRKRSSVETEATFIRSNTAIQAWELYQQLKINAKAGIKRPGAAARPVLQQPHQSSSWQRDEREDNCPAPCHATTTGGRSEFCTAL